MPPPNDAPAFSTEILLIESGQKNLRVSNPLADLLSEAREQYVWGAKSASESQEIIVRLESETARRLADIHDDSQMFEQQPINDLVAKGQVQAFFHHGFWQAMDTLRDRQQLEELWSSGKAPWKTW